MANKFTKAGGYSATAIARGLRFVKSIPGKTLLFQREIQAKDRWSKNHNVRRLDYNIGIPVAVNLQNGTMHKLTAYVTISIPQQPTAEEIQAASVELIDIFQSEQLADSIKQGVITQMSN